MISLMFLVIASFEHILISLVTLDLSWLKCNIKDDFN